jgi:uncharacterized protein with PIN domain
MNCPKCNFGLERIKRKKYQKILFTDSKRYICYSCNKSFFRTNLFKSILTFLKIQF